MKKLIVLCALIVSLLSATSCRTRAVVTTRPEPPTAVVVRPAAPGPGYVWIDGEWVWNSGKYNYRHGYWVPARSGHTWIAGHWVPRGNGWYWERVYWR
jgi:hypothetical protein